jgi:hypothetical protein
MIGRKRFLHPDGRVSLEPKKQNDSATALNVNAEVRKKIAAMWA